MVESLQMFLFLFKSKYRRKFSWFSPFLCSVLIVLLFCDGVLSRCSDHNCINGVCKNDTCVCYEGWQGPECQYCGGKVKLTSPTGVITDGPGNYSVSTQCSWLLAPPWLGPGPPALRVRLESFATECGWDHLYVYDGDSVRAERLLAVFSGVLEPGESGWTRQVIARSGSALLHFFSDDAYAMEGFNVTYAAYSCPSDDHRTNCSNHGECEDGTCRCESDWYGVACDQPVCPDDCNAAYGAGSCTAAGCACTPSRAGSDCSRDAAAAGWGWAWREAGDAPPDQPPPENTPVAAAGHVLLNYGEDLLRVGGETFAPAPFLYSVLSGVDYTLRLGNKTEVTEFVGWGWAWREAGDSPPDQPPPENTPVAAAGHVLLNYGEDLLRVGGGLHVSGHSAVVVRLGPTRKPVMLVFFGHSPHYGYLHTVQEYYIEEGVWAAAETHGWAARAGFGHSAAWDPLSGRVYVHGGLVSESEATQAWAVETHGWAARAGFGHSAAWDPLSGRVYVHGGLVSESEATQGPSAALYEYDVNKKIWKPLPSAPSPRYLHTATFVSPGIMLVFGGNAHNDSLSVAAASRCYSAGALLYNVRCKTWITSSSPTGAARAAHAAASLPQLQSSQQSRRAAIIHGGFDGRLRSDALLFETGDKCSSYNDEVACVAAANHAARACAWHVHKRICMPLEEVGWKESFEGDVKACVTEPTFDERLCASAESCGACTAAGCAWCGACLASALYCTRHTHQMALSLEECGATSESPREACGRFHSCAACYAHQHHHTHGSEELTQRLCYWDYDTIKCKPANSSDDIRSVASAGPCSAPCSTFQTCANCTAEECIWCASAGRCVDKNAYGASFPLGGCRLWSTSGGVSTCGDAHGCAAHVSCSSCRAEPACGWCDDGAGGGRGVCLPGGARRPHAPRVCAQHRMTLMQLDLKRTWEEQGEHMRRDSAISIAGFNNGEMELNFLRLILSYAYGASFPLGGCRLWSVHAATPTAAPPMYPAARAALSPLAAGATMALAVAAGSACREELGDLMRREFAHSIAGFNNGELELNFLRLILSYAYGASFPLGGCRLWSTSGGAHGCAAHVSCSSCRAEPACGWCDDGAGGGRGVCLPGGARRPHAPRVCAQHRWHFTRCPACQCNGHAICDSSARCIQPCSGRAIGDHCDTCAPGHWGHPLNGGSCQPCDCNSQAVSCAPDSGRCYCTTKGLAGDRCDKCDNTNHYHADIYNKGACYYDLAVDYQFTFNLSKKEDRHLTAINFRNAPVKPDVDADFSITCSAHARMNLTVRTRAEPAERTLFSDVNCTNFRYKFAKSEHSFGVEDNVTLTTFFVYVYDFRPPLWIQISFSQYPKLNLQQFFITFSSCFLLLLLVAAALWKIKQKYDLYRRRQRLFVEMEQMASRPFSQVCVELERGWVGGGKLTIFSRLKMWRKPSVPAPVALEPCRGGRAAVLSLLVRLPTGGSGRAPPLGGLAVASALVTLGHHAPPAPAKLARCGPVSKRRSQGERLKTTTQHIVTRRPEPVLSLLVRLPTGGSGRAPPLGGLAVASALVTLGHHAPPAPAKRPDHR
ncbi:attractin-like protein 1 [Ostrinia nubilalis]|uniref:attractin-like protein 1 n=1 Tax=Ostrinia nubilalis TaxID=29057 RepID=UPI0030824F60